LYPIHNRKKGHLQTTAIMVIIPLMVFPFSVAGGYLILLIEVVWWIVNTVDKFAYGKR
jgi:hypothetical protein